VARSIFAFAADKDGQVITETKNSLGHSNLPSLAYRLLFHLLARSRAARERARRWKRRRVRSTASASAPSTVHAGN